jgi:hypothetical protein
LSIYKHWYEDFDVILETDLNEEIRFKDPKDILRDFDDLNDYDSDNNNNLEQLISKNNKQSYLHDNDREV